MGRLVTRFRVGVAALALAGAMWGVTTVLEATPTADAVQCVERYVGPPINENGILCPGNPTIWKSFTFASHGFGYYTEVYDLGNGQRESRIGYRHRDGRTAISIADCDARGCRVKYTNGVPFPGQS